MLDLEWDFSYYHIILWKKNMITRHYKMYFLSFEFLNEDFDYILLLKFDFPDSYVSPDIHRIIESLDEMYRDEENILVVLTNRKEPPLDSVRAGEFVYSFSCRMVNFKKIVSLYPKSEFVNKNLLFELLDRVFDDHSVFKKIFVRQIPIENSPKISISDCDVVIPHRGDENLLRNALSFLDALKNLKIHVGIDQDITEVLSQIRKNYAHMSFYHFFPNPVGPYVIRNYLINQSTEKLIFYQDSDDIPCADRFEKIAYHMTQTACQLCGSHELRLDYFDRTVRAFRFPVNVYAALAKEPGHPLLHPTSAITRDAFYLCGRLSEERIFGNDTKFLLHSFFFLRDIRNVDEFLYIRRRRPGSLTTAPETMIGSPLRRNLLHSWNEDFVWVKAGLLSLENSSLNYQPPSFSYNAAKL